MTIRARLTAATVSAIVCAYFSLALFQALLFTFAGLDWLLLFNFVAAIFSGIFCILQVSRL